MPDQVRHDVQKLEAFLNVERTAIIKRKQYGKRISVSREGDVYCGQLIILSNCGIVKFRGDRNLKNNHALAKNGYPTQPVVAVGAIVFNNNRVLLVKRAQPPSQDLWAIPGGRVEIGETLQQAAEREILEETGIIIQAREPVYTFDYIERDGSAQARFHYVIIDLDADYVKGATRAGDDAADVRWVAAEELASLNVSSKTLGLLKTRYNFGI
jgi:ADP-ribose pyrophosphatase